MTLFGLSPAALLAGALVLTSGLVLLHLLRVRLRAVEVDTLLFWKLAGALQKPRVLPGRPSRWLALLLSLLVALLAWLALGAPRSGLDAPSRFVVVEPDAATSARRLARVHEVLAAGLGPRGLVLAATSPPRVLWTAGEPSAALDERGQALATGAATSGALAALQAARDHARPGDDIVWLASAPLPTVDPTVRHLAVEPGDATRLVALAWQRQENGDLLLQARGVLRGGELRAGDAVVASATAATGLPVLTFGPFPPGQQTHFTLALAGLPPIELTAPTMAPAKVFVAADLPSDLAQAVAAVLAVDGELQSTTEARDADVVVAISDGIDDHADLEPKPRLVLTPGVGDGPRQARRTADSPVPVSLRDGQRRQAAALPPLPAPATVWIEDAAQGGALAAATHDGGRARVWLVDWLVRPITRADTPALLAHALRELAARPAPLLAIAGQPFVLPTGFAAPVPFGDSPVRAVDGELVLRPTQPGAATLPGPRGPRPVTILASARGAGADVPADAAPALPTRSGDGSWVPWLALLLLLLLATDTVLYHRGRLP